MEQLVSNIGEGLRFVDINGRQFAIAPITMIVPGVLPGSKGPLLYPKEEIGKNVDQWNGKPLVVYHPYDSNGTPISAANPETFKKQEIGKIYSTRVEGNKLVADGYFDLELTKKLDSRVYQRLMNKVQTEISTGLFTENTPAPPNSQVNGQPYSYVARNYKPDHLAILPDEKGACSLADGCGVFNKKENYPESCPHCNTKLEIDPDSGICNRCNKKVSPIANDDLGTKEKYSYFVSECPHCGSLNHNGYTCLNCGKSVPINSTSLPLIGITDDNKYCKFNEGGEEDNVTNEYKPFEDSDYVRLYIPLLHT